MRADSLCAAMLLALAGCGGRVHSERASGSASDAGSDAGVHAPQCKFTGFAPAVSYTPADEPVALTAIPATGTGLFDLIVGERTSVTDYHCELFGNAGDGTFVSRSSFGAGGNDCRNVVAADFNADGKVDLASQANAGGESDAGSGVLGIDFGTGKHEFAPTLAQLPMPRADSVVVAGDFNGDGQPDIAAASFDYMESGGGGLPVPEPMDFTFAVLLSTASGQLGPPVTYSSPQLAPGDLATGDLNGDGQLRCGSARQHAAGGH